MQKRWLLHERYPQSFGEQFPEHSPLLLQLLFDRGLSTQTQMDEFFHPDYESDLHDPYLLKDMNKAVERIFAALLGEEKILVYGDYDVDGVTSSAVITSTLTEIKRVLQNLSAAEAGTFLSIYIPDREKEGYGITEQAIEEMSKRRPGLIVTVDCGVSNVESVDKINELGIDIIVTDHHHVPEVRPRALAIINPKQSDCPYPFKLLAGVGVAFKLAQALLLHLHREFPQEAERLQAGFEKWLLDLVALGTVADCVDLLGENRTLTHYGLLVLSKTRRPGIKQLMSSAGMEKRASGNRESDQTIDTDRISFQLAPRLNAAGRMDHANAAYRLLMTEDPKEAAQLAAQLEKSNQERQQLTEEMMQEIRGHLAKQKSIPKVMIEKGKGWKIGLVGLVAGKLTEEYSRPFLVLNQEGDQLAGSGRSIPPFDLIAAIEQCSASLLQFGGHAMAAGVKLKKNKFKQFAQQMEEIAERTLEEEDLRPSLEIDAQLLPEEIDWQLMDTISQFAPFGFANRKPAFLMRDLEVDEAKAVGNQHDHLKLCLKTILASGEAKYFPAIGFRLGHLLEEMPGKETGLRWGDRVDVAFQIEVNEWNGNRELQLHLLDIRLAH